MLRALLLVLLLMAPLALAGPGHSGGVNDVPRLWPLTVELTGDEVKGGNILAPTSQPAGMVLLSARNRADVPIDVLLYLEEAVLATWTIPADGTTHVHHHRLTEAGNVSVDFDAHGADDDTVHRLDFFIDFSDCTAFAAECFTKHLPWEVPRGAMVFPYTTAGSGTYRATFVQPPVHDLRVEIRDASGILVETTPLFADEEEIVVQWEANASSLYHFFVHSVAHDRNAFFNEFAQPDPETTRVTVVVEGPLVKDSPAPVALALLALATLVLRKRE